MCKHALGEHFTKEPHRCTECVCEGFRIPLTKADPPDCFGKRFHYSKVEWTTENIPQQVDKTLRIVDQADELDSDSEFL